MGDGAELENLGIGAWFLVPELVAGKRQHDHVVAVVVV